MNEVDYQHNFPTGVSVPDILRAVLHFQNQTREWYAGHFELTLWEFGKPHLFRGDRSAAEQFIIIGQGPDGSLYALWMYPGRTSENAPIVFLGSEGVDSSLIANNLYEFMSLLAIGSSELGFDISRGEITTESPPAKRLEEFRAWLKKNYKIFQPSEPFSLIIQARNNHPDFCAWLTSWQSLHA